MTQKSNFFFIGDLTADFYVYSKTVKLGGAALNSAIWAKRNGARASIVSAVGNDEAGYKFLDKVRKETLSPDGIQQKQGATSRIEIFVADSGERLYGAWEPGVLATYHLRKKDSRLLRSSDAVAITVYPQYIHILDECLALKQAIRTKHRPLFVINYGNLHEFHNSLDVAKRYGELADILVFGLDKDCDEALISEIQQYALSEKKFTLVTLGKYGSIAWDGTNSFAQQTKDVVARDTTGAGDAFLAGFLVAYFQKRGVQQALEEGTALASRAIQIVGAY